MFALCGEFKREHVIIPLCFHTFCIFLDLCGVFGEHLLDTSNSVCARTFEWNFELHILMYLIY